MLTVEGGFVASVLAAGFAAEVDEPTSAGFQSNLYVYFSFLGDRI